MGSRRMPDFKALLSRLSRVLEEREVPFMIIGGQAVLLHGEPRLTQDVDVTLGVGPAGRPRDIEDAVGVVRRKGLELDWDYLHRWAAEFALVPGRESLPDALEELRSELGAE